MRGTRGRRSNKRHDWKGDGKNPLGTNAVFNSKMPARNNSSFIYEIVSFFGHLYFHLYTEVVLHPTREFSRSPTHRLVYAVPAETRRKAEGNDAPASGGLVDMTKVPKSTAPFGMASRVWVRVGGNARRVQGHSSAGFKTLAA
jgi:hypothetical protein